jgi:hypothetical protein
MLTDAQLQDLARRALMSAQRGYTLARSDFYAAQLAEEAGSSGAGSSASAIHALCQAVLAKRSGAPAKAPKPKAEPAPETPADDQTPPSEDDVKEPPAETEEVKAEEAESEESKQDAILEETKVEEGGYETWTRDALYEEAKVRGIEGRSEMNKADLVAALTASDEKPEA